ncbi:MAG: alpha/beta fold hydrolase, partial [Ilumatobacteraceae bacterium]
ALGDTALGNTVMWQAWNVPDMPWDGSRAVQLDLASGSVREVRGVGAIQQPRWMPDGTPIWVRDDDGWLNVWLGDRPLLAEPFEHAGPSWGQGQRSYAISPDGRRVAVARNEHGFGRLCVIDVAAAGESGGESRSVVQEVARGVHGQLSWVGSRLAALRSGARTPTQVVLYDTTTWERTVLAVGPLSGWEDAALVEPEPIRVVGRDGSAVHARLYRADAAGEGDPHSGSDQQSGVATPRLLCWVHGGPTDQWQVSFMPRVAYWRAQGWNVVLPDHRGSTGHGRAYQQAMNGRWGELDVSDTVDCIRFAHAQGWGDPDHTVVLGGSAGGFTALCVAAVAPELIAGVAAAYPVTDLLDLAARSHRFERHSTEHLVGPLPATAALYEARSPLLFAQRLTSRPVLLLHGDADPVVPVEQSRELARRIADAGGDVQLHVYAGAGHGLRDPLDQLDEYARIGDFLSRCLADG